jgi:phosphoglycolate phosphatase/pyrophosphatase PpaX
MLVIFDLDLTLINTSALQTLRDNRRWREIKSRLGETNLYPGIREMVQAFRDKNISMAVVTNSPGTYANDLLFHHSLPVKTVVAYHDTRRHKPYPDPMELAMQLSHSTARNTVAIGDAVNDIRAAKAAGICSCAALWDCNNIDVIRCAEPDREFRTPQEFLEFVLQYQKQ